MRNIYLDLVADTAKAMQEQFSSQDTFFCTKEEKALFAPQKSVPNETILPKPNVVKKDKPIEAPPFKPEVKAEVKTPLKEQENKPVATQVLEKPSKSAPAPSKEWKDLCQKIVPNWTIREDVPSDEEAKRNAEAWKEPKVAKVLLFSFKETEEELLFLKNISRAIDLYLAPAKIINAAKFEEENKWEGFFKRKGAELIIAPPALHQTKELRSFYKEIPSTSELFLAEIPLFVLKSLKEYMKDPLAKKMLWQSLCQILKK